jgi:hypothetical protein
MFKITRKKGFHITFENGYTVSVQFGPGNYCDNYNRRIPEDEEACGEEGSTTAECAVWNSRGKELIPYSVWHGDMVSNRSTPAKVLELLNWAASQPVEV